MQNSIKNKILDFLKDGDWKYGGQIEDFIRSTDGHKASNASRRCRELEDEGRVESRYVRVEGVANKVVQYRLKSTRTQETAPQPTYLEKSMTIMAQVTYGPPKCCAWDGKNGIHSSNCPLKEKQVEKINNTLF